MNDNGFYEYVNLTSNSVFMRSYKYKDVKDTADADEIIRYNKTRMSIVFPDVGPEPPNSNGLLAGSRMPNDCHEVSSTRRIISRKYNVL